MLSDTNETNTQFSKYLAEKDTVEVSPIPKDEKLKPQKKYDEPSWKDKENDESNEYEYSNNENETDDTKW